MAQTQVQILEIKDDHLIVSGQRTGGCSACAQRQTCGVKGAELESKRSFTLEVPYSQEESGLLQPGETISVACSETHLLKAIATLFGIPLLGLVFAPLMLMLCSGANEPSDPAIFISAVGGTLAGLLASRKMAATFTTPAKLAEPTIRIVTDLTKSS